jgi:hypothetical protein
MAAATTTSSTPQPPQGDVIATLNFYSPPEDRSTPYMLAGDVPADVDPSKRRNFSDVGIPVLIRDVRANASDYSLDRDAFQIVLNQPPSSEQSFTDDASIEANYYPEVTALLHSLIPSAHKVVIFDHTIRRAAADAPRTPVNRVHIDQTPSSAMQRVRRHGGASSPEEAEALLAGRYRIINVWRPLNRGPVESSPLAFASSSTLRDEDIVPVEHRYVDSGYVGQTAAIKYHEGQKWYYLSGMTGDERILLECFDSEALRDGTAVQGGRVPHSAFEDPRTREGVEARESIEVRALVFG